MAESKQTTDHEEIRRWAEQRGGRPAIVASDAGGFGLRIDFPEDEDEHLEQISWDEFFQRFDELNLVFVYRDEGWVC